MKYVACVGEHAFQNRIGVDLQHDPMDRRIITVRQGRDVHKLRGLRGPDVLWLDMGASPEQAEICRVRQFKLSTAEEAREVLWKRAELVEFDRLVEQTANIDQVVRIGARLRLRTFVNEKGRPKCDAMYSYLDSHTVDGKRRR